MHQTNAGPDNTGPPIVIQTTNPRPINKANVTHLTSDFRTRGVFNRVVENAIYIICPFSSLHSDCLTTDPSKAQPLRFIGDTSLITIIIMNGHHRLLAIRAFLNNHLKRLEKLMEELAELKANHTSASVLEKFANKQKSVNVVKEHVSDTGYWLCSVINSGKFNI